MTGAQSSACTQVFPAVREIRLFIITNMIKDAFRNADAARVRDSMRTHIEQAEAHMVALEAVLERRFLDK